MEGPRGRRRAQQGWGMLIPVAGTRLSRFIPKPGGCSHGALTALHGVAGGLQQLLGVVPSLPSSSGPFPARHCPADPTAAGREGRSREPGAFWRYTGGFPLPTRVKQPDLAAREKLEPGFSLNHSGVRGWEVLPAEAAGVCFSSLIRVGSLMLWD